MGLGLLKRRRAAERPPEDRPPVEQDTYSLMVTSSPRLVAMAVHDKHWLWSTHIRADSTFAVRIPTEFHDPILGGPEGHEQHEQQHACRRPPACPYSVACRGAVLGAIHSSNMRACTALALRCHHARPPFARGRPD